jgi:hypothetical protein
MKRASNIEKAHRINLARKLIKKYNSTSELANELSKQFDCSERQAKRYIQMAKSKLTPEPIPDVKVAFTIKLSKNLLQRLRDFSLKSDSSLSEIVTSALETFLLKMKKRG